jgi:hypothetical protein
MTILRSASVRWGGCMKDGIGAIFTQSGTLRAKAGRPLSKVLRSVVTLDAALVE